jgi:hypothetical protein
MGDVQLNVVVTSQSQKSEALEKLPLTTTDVARLQAFRSSSEMLARISCSVAGSLLAIRANRLIFMDDILFH